MSQILSDLNYISIYNMEKSQYTYVWESIFELCSARTSDDEQSQLREE